jgi:proteasome lid subunit RPN8/RPN11
MRQKTIDAIMAHAAAEYPRECCGVVAQKSRVERYFPCRNLAAAPEDILSFARKTTPPPKTGER